MLRAEFVRLEPGLKFPFPDVEGLTFTIKLENIWTEDIRITMWDAEADVYASFSHSAEHFFLGHARGIMPPVLELKTAAEFQLALRVNYDRLERLEALRSGGRPRFRIPLSLLFTVSGKADTISNLYKVINSLNYQALPLTNEVLLVRGLVHVDNPKWPTSMLIEVSIDEWLEVLSKLGLKRVRVLEVPAIPLGEDSHLKNTVENLDRAWKLMVENYEESLNACRKALEELKNYTKEHGLTDESGKDIDFAKIYGGEKFGEAVDSIFRSLWKLTDIGSHTGRSKMTTRSDMEFIITSVYMLLKSLLEVQERRK